MSPAIAPARSGRLRWAPASAGTAPATRPAEPLATPSSASQEQWFDPTAFVTQAAGTFGDTGRGDFEGPNLRTVDLSMSKSARLHGGSRVEVRLEAFNVLNRANFAPPNLSVFAGSADVEQPLPNFGRIRSTVTSSRQIQLGVRLLF